MNDDSTRNHTHHMAKGFFLGTEMMLMQAPFVNALNAISVTASKQGTNSFKAGYLLYLGTHFNQNPPTVFNYFRGISAHLVKETPRLTFKPVGLYTLKPWLDTNFNPGYATVQELMVLDSFLLGVFLHLLVN